LPALRTGMGQRIWPCDRGTTLATAGRYAEKANIDWDLGGGMARVAVVGVGAIGGALASLLETAGGHEITLCTRRPTDGLTVKTPDGVVQVRARNITEPAQAEPVDWVLVATKAYDAEGTAAWLKGLCNAETAVAIFQNGVEHRERFLRWVAGDRLVPVVIDCPAERPGDGTVVVRGATTMKVETGALSEEMAGLFKGSAADVELTADWKSAAWRKLCINAPGALSALALKPTGILREGLMSRMLLGMVGECVAVGRAEGATLEDGMGERVLAVVRGQPWDSVNSMLADRLAGRRMETDARNGAVVRAGERHGIATPLNLMAVAVLEAL